MTGDDKPKTWAFDGISVHKSQEPSASSVRIFLYSLDFVLFDSGQALPDLPSLDLPFSLIRRDALSYELVVTRPGLMGYAPAFWN